MAACFAYEAEFNYVLLKLLFRPRDVEQTSCPQSMIQTVRPRVVILMIVLMYIPYCTQNRGLNGFYHVLWAWCLFSISWPESKDKKNIAAGSLSTKSVACLFCWRGKADFAEPLQEEETNRVCESFTPDNTATGQFAFHVSWPGVAEDQIVDQIYSKIQLPKACYCCMIYGIRTMPNKAEAICYNNIHECH